MIIVNDLKRQTRILVEVKVAMVADPSRDRIVDLPIEFVRDGVTCALPVAN